MICFFKKIYNHDEGEKKLKQINNGKPTREMLDSYPEKMKVIHFEWLALASFQNFTAEEQEKIFSFFFLFFGN